MITLFGPWDEPIQQLVRETHRPRQTRCRSCGHAISENARGFSGTVLDRVGNFKPQRRTVFWHAECFVQPQQQEAQASPNSAPLDHPATTKRIETLRARIDEHNASIQRTIDHLKEHAKTHKPVGQKLHEVSQEAVASKIQFRALKECLILGNLSEATLAERISELDRLHGEPLEACLDLKPAEFLARYGAWVDEHGSAWGISRAILETLIGATSEDEDSSP